MRVICLMKSCEMWDNTIFIIGCADKKTEDFETKGKNINGKFRWYFANIMIIIAINRSRSVCLVYF